MNKLKVDLELPTITGIEDIIVQVGGNVDLLTGVEVSDTISGLDGTFEVSEESIDTSVAKTVEVKYTVKDSIYEKSKLVYLGNKEFNDGDRVVVRLQY